MILILYTIGFIAMYLYLEREPYNHTATIFICSFLWPLVIVVALIAASWRTIYRLLLCLMLIGPAFSVDEVPSWILRGILMVESRSYYKDGVIVYIDRSRGAAGERGCFQMMEATFREIRAPGERFEMLDDPVFSEYKAICYLRLLHKRHGNWPKAVIAYNGGRKYLKDVQNASRP